MTGNQPTLAMKRWQKPGDVTNIQKFTQAFADAYTRYSNSQNYGDNSISDASFIRLKNLSLSFNLPSKAILKIHATSCKIYFQGQNLLTLTHYMGMDPETGHDGYIPPLRVLTIGLQLTF
jgi:hypothetical protein